MPAITASGAYKTIVRHAQKIRNDDPHTIATMSESDMWPQGDVGILCLDALPPGAVEIEKPSLQLAPGTTQGSRHILDRQVRQYRWEDATPLDGPILDAPEGCTITHPEHGDVTLPAGIYAIIYQRQHAEELRRVQD